MICLYLSLFPRLKCTCTKIPYKNRASHYLVECPGVYILEVATCRLKQHLLVNHPGRRCLRCQEWLSLRDYDWLGHERHQGKFCCALCGRSHKTRKVMLDHLDIEHNIQHCPLPRTTFENEEEIQQRNSELSKAAQEEMLRIAADAEAAGMQEAAQVLAAMACGVTKRARQLPTRYREECE